MYEYISGKLVEKKATSAVLDAGGVGYSLLIPVSTFSALPELGQNAKLLAHFVVREDAQTLFGFATDEERQLFRLLLSVSGVGPKIAITVLSGIPIPELKRAIVDGNLAVLTGVSGIGRKTAERLVIELREKIVVEERKGTLAPGARGGVDESLLEDSLRALIELGYRKPAAQEALQKAVKHVDPARTTVPELIRASLKFV